MKNLFLLSLLFSASSIYAVTPHAYVTDQLSKSVQVIDISNDTVQTISGFDGPHVIKVTADGTLAYVGSDDDTLRIIDTATNTVLPTVINIKRPVALAITPDGKFVYVISSYSVIIIQTSDNTVLTEITGFQKPQDIKITPNGEFAYVTDAGQGTVTVIRIADNAIVDTIHGFQRPVGLTITRDGSHAYVTDTTHNAVYVLELSNNTIVDTILGLSLPAYIAVTPDKDYAIVSNSGNNTVSLIRNSDHVIADSISIPSPKSVAVTPDGEYLYIGSDFGTVFKVRLIDRTILTAIPGFENPSNITITTNNAPANTVNGCQIRVSPIKINNKIFWKPAPGNPIGYKIFRDIKLNIPIDTLDATTLEYTDQFRQEGQTYSYYVIALYDNGFYSTIGNVEIDPHRLCQGQ